MASQGRKSNPQKCSIPGRLTYVGHQAKLGFLPSFSIRYRYRPVIVFSRAALMIRPSVSGLLCTYSPPPYIIILIYAIFIMARQFNYKWIDSSQLTELNIEYQPRQIKKTRFCRGNSTRLYPPNPSFLDWRDFFMRWSTLGVPLLVMSSEYESMT